MLIAREPAPGSRYARLSAGRGWPGRGLGQGVGAQEAQVRRERGRAAGPGPREAAHGRAVAAAPGGGRGGSVGRGRRSAVTTRWRSWPCRHARRGLQVVLRYPERFLPRMNDRPAASMAFWFASEIISASAKTVTSGSWQSAVNALITGRIVSALLPSNAETVSGNPSWPLSRPMVICGFRRRSLENPGLAGPVPGVGLEVEHADVVEHQAGRAVSQVRTTGTPCP